MKLGCDSMAEIKFWRNEKRTMLKDVVPLDTPYNIAIEASSLCNMKCIYCAHSRKDHGVYEGNMSMELFEKAIDEIEEFPEKVKLIDLYAFGEPLCHPQLAKMIAMIKDADIAESVGFTSNGLLFTHERTDEIIASGVDIIRISLQGLDSIMYKKMCGVPIDFEQFHANLKYLYENRSQCKIRMKIADIALKGVPDAENKFQELFGDIADSLFVERILPLYFDVDYDKVDSTIKNNAMNGRGNVQQHNINKVCHRPFYKLRIAANGDVTANCCDLPHDIKYGNIYKSSLINLWNGKVRTALLKMQLRGERFSYHKCKTCILPNDITNKADVLDPWAEEILQRFEI